MGSVTVSARLRRNREQVEDLLDRSVTPPARSRRSLGLVATLRSSPPHLPHAVDDVQIPGRILPCKRPDLDSGVLLRGATVTDLLATPTEAERCPRLRLASYPFRPRRAQRPLLLGDKGEVAPAVMTAIVAVWSEAIASVGCEGVAVVVRHGRASRYRSGIGEFARRC
jgi:hypothetical protein